MRKYAMVLYENEKDRVFLLEKTGEIPWLSCTSKKLGEAMKTERAQLVLGREDTLPSLLKLKALLHSVSDLPLLVFVPSKNLSVLKMLESEICFLVSEDADQEELSSLILKLVKQGATACCAEKSTCNLTQRERQIIALVISGQDNRQIATKLGIKLSTVSAHKKNLFLKTGVHTTSQLVVWAMVRDMEFS
jgi:DNA-binding CsgD family transcriptional regulator